MTYREDNPIIQGFLDILKSVFPGSTGVQTSGKFKTMAKRVLISMSQPTYTHGSSGRIPRHGGASKGDHEKGQKTTVVFLQKKPHITKDTGRITSRHMIARMGKPRKGIR